MNHVGVDSFTKAVKFGKNVLELSRFGVSSEGNDDCSTVILLGRCWILWDAKEVHDIASIFEIIDAVGRADEFCMCG